MRTLQCDHVLLDCLVLFNTCKILISHRSTALRLWSHCQKEREKKIKIHLLLCFVFFENSNLILWKTFAWESHSKFREKKSSQIRLEFSLKIWRISIHQDILYILIQYFFFDRSSMLSKSTRTMIIIFFSWISFLKTSRQFSSRKSELTTTRRQKFFFTWTLESWIRHDLSNLIREKWFASRECSWITQSRFEWRKTRWT